MLEDKSSSPALAAFGWQSFRGGGGRGAGERRVSFCHVHALYLRGWGCSIE